MIYISVGFWSNLCTTPDNFPEDNNPNTTTRTVLYKQTFIDPSEDSKVN